MLHVYSYLLRMNTSSYLLHLRICYIIIFVTYEYVIHTNALPYVLHMNIWVGHGSHAPCFTWIIFVFVTLSYLLHMNMSYIQMLICVTYEHMSRSCFTWTICVTYEHVSRSCFTWTICVTYEYVIHTNALPYVLHMNIWVGHVSHAPAIVSYRKEDLFRYRELWHEWIQVCHIAHMHQPS